MNTQPITQPITHQSALREAELRVRLEELQADDNRDHEAIRRVQVELSVITRGTVLS